VFGEDSGARCAIGPKRAGSGAAQRHARDAAAKQRRAVPRKAAGSAEVRQTFSLMAQVEGDCR